MASSNVLTPATDAVICGNSLYALTPRLGALLAFPLVNTDENCMLRMSALSFFINGTTPLFSFFLLLMKDQNFSRFISFFIPGISVCLCVCACLYVCMCIVAESNLDCSNFVA